MKSQHKFYKYILKKVLQIYEMFTCLVYGTWEPSVKTQDLISHLNIILPNILWTQLIIFISLLL